MTKIERLIETFLNNDMEVSELTEKIETLYNNGELRNTDQLDKLAQWIMKNVSGEPSRNEGVVDCAIRIMSTLPKRETNTGSMPCPKFVPAPLAACPFGGLCGVSKPCVITRQAGA